MQIVFVYKQVVFPDAFDYVAIRLRESAGSMSFAFLPVAFEDSTILPLHLAKSVSFIEVKLSFVSATRRPFFSAFSRSLSLDEAAFIVADGELLTAFRTLLPLEEPII